MRLAFRTRPDGIEKVDNLKINVEAFDLQGFVATSYFPESHRQTMIFEFCDCVERRVQNVLIGHAGRLLLDLGYSIYRRATFILSVRRYHGYLFLRGWTGGLQNCTTGSGTTNASMSQGI